MELTVWKGSTSTNHNSWEVVRTHTKGGQKAANLGPRINEKQFKSRFLEKAAHLIHFLAKHPIYQRKTIDCWHISTIELLWRAAD